MVRISKIADIVDGQVMWCSPGSDLASEAANILAKLPQVQAKALVWEMTIAVGQGKAARSVLIPLNPCISEAESAARPLFLGENKLVAFQSRLFMTERPPRGAAELDEVSLRVRKAVYDENAGLASIRAAVANVEAAIELSRSGPRREAIAEDVKLLVWARDGGACVRCGSKQNLHFDHIIPVAKGGGNSVENIQILCQPCNLRKADKISG